MKRQNEQNDIDAEENEVKSLNKFHPDEMSIDEIIKSCGNISYPLSKMFVILSDRMSRQDLDNLKVEIDIAHTHYYNLYYGNKFAAEMEDLSLIRARGNSAAEEKPADLIKLLYDIKRRDNINRVIESRFGINLDEE